MFNSLLTWLIKKRIHQIELFIKYPFEANLLQVEKLSGVNAGESGEFVYDQVDDAWSYFGSEGEFKLKR